MSDLPFISCTGLTKVFGEKDLNVSVLRGVDLELDQGERLAIMGSSGSDKRTLLHLGRQPIR